MNILKLYYEKIIKYDLINKFLYNNVKELPRIKKIVLNFGCKNFELKNLAPSLLALELITNKKIRVTKAKKANILLKIRKGHPVGCSVLLRNNNVYKFLDKLLIEIIPNLKDFKGINSNKKNFDKTNISFTLKELITFKELEIYFYLFNKLPPLNITIVTNTKTRKELLYLINSLKFYFIKNLQL